MESDLVQRAGIPYAAIPAAGVHGVGWRALPRNIGLLIQGVFASMRILRQFKPDGLFFTGGYVAAPMAVAGWRRPILLYVPDIEPGLALKFLARFADCIALTAEESRRYFPARAHTVVTGYPVRESLRVMPQAEARASLNLSNDLPVIMVSGGSKGARSINRALAAILPQLLAQAQVIHLSGQLDWPEVSAAQDALPADLQARYRAFPYLHEEMGAAFSCADLIVTRAGASTLGELPHFALPAVLVPYPHAWRYQKVNADALAQHGAAQVLPDGALQTDLLPTLQQLLSSPQQLDSMRAAMRSLAHSDAAARIAQLAAELTQGGKAW